MKKILTIALSLLTLTVIAGCNSPSENTQETQSATTSEPGTITISNFEFSLSTIEVTLGSKVTWTNQDQAPHSIVSQDGTLSSPNLKQGESFDFTFDSAGTYDYSCGIHPSMKGQVIVK
ncbi:cupredoxin family copper-binding protein [Candidatus Peregrinibacteria bacterium]|nr:cupredoxin family copper-binding protein [Candidatus Peregrinibacteria bacterium]